MDKRFCAWDRIFLLSRTTILIIKKQNLLLYGNGSISLCWKKEDESSRNMSQFPHFYNDFHFHFLLFFQNKIRDISLNLCGYWMLNAYLLLLFFFFKMGFTHYILLSVNLEFENSHKIVFNQAHAPLKTISSQNHQNLWHHSERIAFDLPISVCSLHPKIKSSQRERTNEKYTKTHSCGHYSFGITRLEQKHA